MNALDTILTLEAERSVKQEQQAPGNNWWWQLGTIEKAQQELADLRAKIASLESRLAEALERNVELEDERKWQPISTAPRDGTKILTLSDNGDVNTAEWYIDFWMSNSSPLSEETHWMPLPKTPERAKW